MADSEQKTTAPSAQDGGTTDSSPIDPVELQGRIEAALLTSERPINSTRIGQIVGQDGAEAGTKSVNDAIAALNQSYEQTRRSFRIEQVAGGWQIMTLPQYASILAALHKTQNQGKLSPAAMETLAIIAYKQPILRADIEAIRGVASGEVLRSLMERHMVKIVGRAEELGRPMLYGTTKTFLEVFGLSGLKDLPKPEELSNAESKSV